MPGSEKSLEMDQFDKPQVLAILDLVALHTTTTEFSAQGLSRTFATAVESAYHAGIGLMLCECSNAVDPSSSDWGARLWNTQVPLLNGSLRIRDDSGAWDGGEGIEPVRRRRSKKSRRGGGGRGTPPSDSRRRRAACPQEQLLQADNERRLLRRREKLNQAALWDESRREPR